MKESTPKLLGIFSLVMITVGSVDSIRNLPSIALFGNSLLFFFICATLLFLLPSTLIAAELATTWPEQGGIYVWVKHAFGSKVALLAIWFQWVENVIWYPTILAFGAATIGFLASPALASNRFFLISIIIVSFWVTTAINLLSIHNAAKISTICTIAGLIFPIIFIISIGISWIIAGKPVQISFSGEGLLPNFADHNMWMALTGTMMAFCGIEITTVHAHQVHKPHSTFPRAFFISLLVLIITLGGGSLAIAAVLPGKDINLMVGIMQIFQTFLTMYHLDWLMPVIAFLVVLGIMGSITNWIVAPTTGLFIAALDGHLPKHFTQKNKNESPHRILIFQAIVVSLLSSTFLFMPTVKDSYWLLTVMTTQLYMLMYVLMFAAALFLRFKHPEVVRPFRIPGKNIGITIVALIGIFGALVTFFAGFSSTGESNHHYALILSLGLIIMSLPPFIFRKPQPEEIKN